MVQLVQGVTLRRAGAALERVQQAGMTVELIASWDGTEVIRQQVPAGKRFGLRPEEGWQALEHLFILSGQAVWEQGGKREVLGPGDSLSGTPVQEPCILRALSDLTALYVCSRPVFHHVSQELANLHELAAMVEEKDGYTREHCHRIQRWAGAMGQLFNLSPGRQHYLLLGSFLHDLGKVRVPDHILKKPGPLTPAEWEVMKKHTTFGREMVSGTFASGAGIILEQHHERLDGSGYPHGLKGDEIALEAQITAVADSYDAMTTDRVYRKAMPHDEAAAELRKCAGKLYRPDVVDAFLTVVT